jgi:hypothetical protein
LTGSELETVQPWFEAAAEQARLSICPGGYCGSVIVKDGRIIGLGYNGQTDGSSERCEIVYDLSVKPKFDKTCCVHAEWRAILDACKRAGDEISGSTLYFMRVDETGDFTDAGVPYCTVCSRLALESGVGWFALWNDNGADIYDTDEYNRKSYEYFK